MADKTVFSQRVKQALDAIDKDYLSYDKSEFWMIERRYQYVKNYAMEKQLYNTSIALPLVRGLHDGAHRKGTVLLEGEPHRMPYVIHCLMVCRMLIDLQLPLSKEDEDILLASALCHDVIEDIDLPEHGKEIYLKFGMDPRVYDTVLLVSKRKDFTEEEHQIYFRKIAENRLSLLIKLSDRGNNVEDLYNMKIWKIHEYIGETRTYFYSMCDYGAEHFPELETGIEMLREKMLTLTETAEIFADRLESREKKLRGQLEVLQAENQRLKAILNEAEA